MNSPLESGLFLPLRFYTSIEEQNRYKPIATGVSLVDETYIYCDCKSLIPFQVIKSEFCDTGIYDISIEAICIDTEEILSLPYNSANWEVYVDYTNHKTYVSYLGTGDFTGYLSSGKFYLRVVITDMCEYSETFISDIFVVRNCDSLYETNDYRITSPSINDKRLIDINTTDLRITK